MSTHMLNQYMSMALGIQAGLRDSPRIEISDGPGWKPSGGPNKAKNRAKAKAARKARRRQR